MSISPTCAGRGVAHVQDSDPDGDGVPYVIRLRYPGQYFDSETKLHYNYFRDYDPGTGRYIQPDPIGLAGGISMYGYVEGNPLAFSDSLALDPEEYFATEALAIADAAEYMKGLPGFDDWEYSAIIVQLDETCEFTYLEPRTDRNPQRVYPDYESSVPIYHVATADIHNHPKGSPFLLWQNGKDPENAYHLSLLDLAINFHYGTRGYLIDPAGTTSLKYTPPTVNTQPGCQCQ